MNVFLLGKSVILFALLFLLLGCGSNFCLYPKSLKTSFEKELKKSCSEVTSEELAQVTKLKFEELKGISNIEPEDLQPFTHLSSLDFSGHKNITEIPDFVYGISKLKKLNISSTGISIFDSKLCQLNNLEALIGKNNSYNNNEIPFHTFCLENLKVLDMSNSGIRYIDEYIGKMTHLEELYLKGNFLVVVPFMLHKLPHLTVIDFTNNYFDNTDLAVLHTCHLESSEQNDQKECREDMQRSMNCDYYHELPYQRKESIRQFYVDISNQNLDQLTNTLNELKNTAHKSFIEKEKLIEKLRIQLGGSKSNLDEFEDIFNSGSLSQEALKDYIAHLSTNISEIRQNLENFDSLSAQITIDRNACYENWIGFTDYNQSPELLEKTINGRTIRELRFIYDQIGGKMAKKWIPVVTLMTGIYNFLATNPYIGFPWFDLPASDDALCWSQVRYHNDRKKRIGWLPYEVYPERYLKPTFGMRANSWFEGGYEWLIPDCLHLPDLTNRIRQVRDTQGLYNE